MGVWAFLGGSSISDREAGEGHRTEDTEGWGKFVGVSQRTACHRGAQDRPEDSILQPTGNWYEKADTFP
jgi:hypothetical protein